MKKLFSLTLGVLLTSSVLWGQSLDMVIANYEAAVGGVEKWQTLQSRKMTGKANQMGMEFPVVMLQARPNKQKLTVDIQGMTIVDAFDGSTGWNINPFMGGNTPTKKTAEESKEAAKQSFEDDLLGYAQKGHQVELNGNETVEGVETIVLKLKTKDGDERIYYMDPDNYVPIMIKSFASSGQMKGMAVEQYMSDYQEVEGMMMPFSMVTKVQGQVIASVTIQKVECNPAVSDSDFAFPGKK